MSNIGERALRESVDCLKSPPPFAPRALGVTTTVPGGVVVTPKAHGPRIFDSDVYNRVIEELCAPKIE